MKCIKVVCFSIAAMLILLGTAHEGYASLILWDKLGLDSEVMNSEIGPDGTITGSVSYSPVKFGNGFTNNNADSYVSFSNSVFDGQKGTIEFWFKTDFGVSNGISQEPLYFPARRWLAQEANQDGQGYFYAFFNDTSNGHDGAFNLWMEGSSGMAVIHAPPAMSWDANTVHHAGIVYDRAGFDGGKTLAMYIDGSEVGNSTTDWGLYNESVEPFLVSTTVIGSGPTGNSQTYFDNLKIWDNVKIDFSDRNTEGVVPEPASMILFGIGSAAMAFVRRKKRA